MISNQQIALGRFRPHPDNYKRHPDAQIERLRSSIRKFGQVRSIVAQAPIDETGDFLIVAGHGLKLAAEAEGVTELRADVIPADWTPEQIKAYLIADNRLAELSESDDAQLVTLLDEIRAIDPALVDAAGYDPSDVDDVIRRAMSAATPPPDPAAPSTRAEDLLAKWQPQTGQIWEFRSNAAPGQAHRLIVGDSTDPPTVERLFAGARGDLLVADPPYNIGKDFISGEGLDPKQYTDFCRAWLLLWQDHTRRQIITPGYANLREWIAGDAIPAPYHVAPWIKRNSSTHGYTSAFFQWEPITFYGPPDEWIWEGVLFYGDGWSRKRASDVFEFSVGVQAHGKGHPDPKPIPFWSDLILSYSSPGSVVADPFAGSGTIFLAAERVGRVGYAAEIDPRYAAISIEACALAGMTPEIKP